MEIRIDQSRKFQPESKPTSLIELLGEVSDWLRAQGRAMLSVRVDGTEVYPSDLPGKSKLMPLDNVELVEIATDEISKLVDTSLKELEGPLPDLAEVCHSLAREFQGESPESGYEPFHRLAEIWQNIKERQMVIARALDLDWDALDVDGSSVKEMHDKLNACLEEAADALTAGDCVLLGDLLEYELAPQAEAEVKIVSLLRDRAQG